jgi:hypothetical protein
MPLQLREKLLLGRPSNDPLSRLLKSFGKLVERGIKWDERMGSPLMMATGPKIDELIKVGAFVARRPGIKDDIDELLDLIRGIERPGIKVYPKSDYAGDVGFPDRIPFLLDKQSGRIALGQPGETHGGLAQSVFRRPTSKLTREDMGRTRQGFFRVHGGTLMSDLDVGTYSGNPLPENVAHLHRLLGHVLRNYSDDVIKARTPWKSTPLLERAIEKNGPERTARLMGVLGITDPKKMEEVLRRFADAERLRKYRR